MRLLYFSEKYQLENYPYFVGSCMNGFIVPMQYHSDPVKDTSLSKFCFDMLKSGFDVNRFASLFLGYYDVPCVDESKPDFLTKEVTDFIWNGKDNAIYVDKVLYYLSQGYVTPVPMEFANESLMTRVRNVFSPTRVIREGSVGGFALGAGPANV